MDSSKKTGAQLVELFQKAVRAAQKVEDDEGNEAEETRCVEALKAMKNVPVTTTILMDTQASPFSPHPFTLHGTTLNLCTFPAQIW